MRGQRTDISEDEDRGQISVKRRQRTDIRKKRGQRTDISGD